MPQQSASVQPPANVTRQVIEYLLKKGYNRTEQMLRLESSNVGPDGKPVQERAEDLSTAKYSKGFRFLSEWVDQNLDIYKVRARHPTPLNSTVTSLNLKECVEINSSVSRRSSKSNRFTLFGE